MTMNKAEVVRQKRTPEKLNKVANDVGKLTRQGSGSRSILQFTHVDARKFFLKAESYCNFDLPPYVVFGDLLAKIDKVLSGKELMTFKIKNAHPRNYDDLNHTILNNKDGKYAWRPLKLIHPAIYVSLVHKITEKKNWELILGRFQKFLQNPAIECVSHPVESLTEKKDKAEQILSWWHEVEQKSIELALDYEYLIQTDIADCYSSIYTHSIPWALHGKGFAKKIENREDKKLIGNVIDSHIQDISYGQTNGIPQGSTLMDFIAEMVFGYADMKLSKKILNLKIDNYHILRYRDDYRIFTNNPQDGETILKLLAEIMIGLGMKINPSKTSATNQVIKKSIKADKLYWIKQGDELHWNKENEKKSNLQKQLLIIHNLAEDFPNSGSLTTALTGFYDRILHRKDIEDSILPIISIITDIVYYNPKIYPIASAILSKFISLINDNADKRSVINRVKTRFDKIPNTGHLQLWLQRITLTFDRTYEYEEPICKAVVGESPTLWNVDWLSSKLGNLMKASKIIDPAKIEELPPVILSGEVELFRARKWIS